MDKPELDQVEMKGVSDPELSPDELIAISDQRLKLSAAERKLLLKADLVIVPIISVAYLASYLVPEAQFPI